MNDSSDTKFSTIYSFMKHVIITNGYQCSTIKQVVDFQKTFHVNWINTYNQFLIDGKIILFVV
jgi:hypothetical protein